MAVSGLLGAMAPVMSPPLRPAAGGGPGRPADAVILQSNKGLDLHVPIWSRDTPRANDELPGPAGNRYITYTCFVRRSPSVSDGVAACGCRRVRLLCLLATVFRPPALVRRSPLDCRTRHRPGARRRR